MMKIVSILLIVVLFGPVLSGSAAQGQLRFTTVFESGTDGYKSFRIPAIISLPNGNLLAFCEGRVKGAGDFGDIDIVMKRSTDKGATWSALTVVADYGELQLCNPAPVVDLTDPKYPNVRIFLFYNTGNKSESDIIKGKGIKHCLYKTSSNGGVTWSEVTDITLMVHRPLQPSADRRYNFTEDWRYYANTPGHAMQFQSGTYRGRIFVAANHSAGEPQKAGGHYLAHGYYTDDHGRSFQTGSSLKLPGSNESMAAELSGSRLMMNSRNQRGDVRARIVSVSSDGGASWDSTWFDKNLPDPVCQGSILNIGVKKGKHIVAFCNAADTLRRNNLTLRISFDEGISWKKNIPVYASADSKAKSPAAYSDLVSLGKKRLGVLFEQDDYKRIVFAGVRW
jgi:sialidase-1